MNLDTPTGVQLSVDLNSVCSQANVHSDCVEAPVNMLINLAPVRGTTTVCASVFVCTREINKDGVCYDLSRGSYVHTSYLSDAATHLQLQWQANQSAAGSSSPAAD